MLTFNMSPLWTKSTEICRSDVTSKSGVMVTSRASVAFNESNFANASDVFPCKKINDITNHNFK